MYSYIAKSVLNDHLGSSNDPCYIQNRVITNRVIKRLRCTLQPINFSKPQWVGRHIMHKMKIISSIIKWDRDLR